MTTSKKFAWNKLFNIAALIPAVCGIGSAIFLGYLILWPEEPIYQVDRVKEHVATYNGTLLIHRFYCVNNPTTPITITRDLIKVGNGDEPQLRISLPQTVQVYEMGCHAIDRVIEIPTVTPPGEYRLVSVATWQANIFRIGTLTLPELYLTIPKREKTTFLPELNVTIPVTVKTEVRSSTKVLARDAAKEITASSKVIPSASNVVPNAAKKP